MKKFLKYALWVLLILFVALYLVFRFALDFNMSEEDKQAFMQDPIIQASDKSYEFEGRNIHYVDAGADTLATILFIHGSPGKWDAYSSYFGDSMLMGRYRMISVDRLGYGDSDPGNPEPSLEMHAKVFEPILASVPDSVPLLVAGHSYGGPVAVRMAMDYPDRVDGLLIMAGIADPKLEKRFWVQPILMSKYLRWLLPPDMDISNREIVPLKGELEKIVDRWKEIKAETIIIQGEEDSLVNPENATFAQQKLQHIPSSLISIPDEDHLVIWTQKALVKSSIQDLFERISKK